MSSRFAAIPKAIPTICAALFVGALLAGCSGGGGGGSAASAGSTSTCPLVEKLDTIVAGIPTNTLADPVAFKKSFETAVDQYAATVRELKRAVPTSLHSDLDRVESDVKQYRFTDAVTHRASLDAYAQRQCKRPLTSTSIPGTSVPSATVTTLAGK